MTRGTTPTLIFDFCCCVDLQYAQKIIVTFTQKGKKLFDIEPDLSTQVEGNKLSITLTQEQTLSLQANQYLNYQVRILINDNVLATPIYSTIVFDCLDDTVLSIMENDMGGTDKIKEIDEVRNE